MAAPARHMITAAIFDDLRATAGAFLHHFPILKLNG
jgi:hypothetical protein